MEWQLVGSIATANNYIFTPVVAGALFKFKHVTDSTTPENLKIVIRQAFDDNGSIALFDYKLINCKLETDLILFIKPAGLFDRKLAIKRVDAFLEDWTVEIEVLDFVEEGVNLPITISDVTDLQQRLDSIQAELVAKALDFDLDTHTSDVDNPHATTAVQVGADPAGTGAAAAANAIATHQGTVDHPVATPAIKGMMSAGDKAKLNEIALYSVLNVLKNAQSIIVTTDILLTFSTVVADTSSSWNANTNQWTCPQSGTYLIAANIDIFNNANTAGEGRLKIYKNNVQIHKIDAKYNLPANTSNTLQGVCSLNLATGDLVDIRFLSTTTNSSNPVSIFASSSTIQYGFTIERIK